MQEMFTQLITEVVQSVTGGLTLEYEGQRLDFHPPFPSLRFADALRSLVPSVLMRRPELAGAIRAAGVRLKRTPLVPAARLAL